MKPSIALNISRTTVRETVERFRVANPRLFGSVLHGTDAEGSDLAQGPAAPRYTQRTLLKSRALSRSLPRAGRDDAAREDANATAAAWLEFGHQPIETHEAIDRLVPDALARPDAGSTPAACNTLGL